MVEDPLEGFREQSPEELEAGLRRNLGGSDYLVDVWQMGEAMRAFIETPAGAFLFTEFRDDFNEQLEKLLEQADPDSAEARNCFYELRATWKTLEKIRIAIDEGRKAKVTIIEADVETEVTP